MSKRLNKICSHELGILSDMEVIRATRDYYFRKCKVCGEVEQLPRAGKIYVGVSLEAETIRDFERREHAKDLLQAWEPGGKVNELFEDAYGDPKERGKAKAGAKIDDMLAPTTEAENLNTPSKLDDATRKAIKKARQKMKERNKP